MNLEKVITVQNYYTKNNTRGNPRRISIFTSVDTDNRLNETVSKEVYSHKSPRQVVERHLEEYVIGERDKDYLVVELPPVEVPVKQYKDLVNS
jgi:hypothetical protein